MVVLAAPRQSRASFLDVHRSDGTGTTVDWDYMEEGRSWSEQGTCGSTDSNQSPVNISTTIAAQAPDKDILFYNYPTYEAPVTMVNDGRFLYTRFANEDGKVGSIALGVSFPYHLSVTYHIYKIVIHTPSEHTFNGEKVPLELQLFHHKKDAELEDGEPLPEETAIVSIGFSESQDEGNKFLQALKDGGLPDQKGATTLDNRGYPSIMKFSDLYNAEFGAHGENAGFWEYSGSLTQPPCSSGVRWFLRADTLNAKKQTLDYFTSVVKKSSGGVSGNARELQVLGEHRPVYPRIAQQTNKLLAFKAEVPSAFHTAYKRLKKLQRSLRKELKADDAGSSAAMEDGASKGKVVLASNEYQACVDELGTFTSDLEIAKTKKENDCNTAKGHNEAQSDVSGGPAQIEAATKAAAAELSCQDQTAVVAAKQGQVDTQTEKCALIEAKIKNKVEEKVTSSKSEGAADAAGGGAEQ